MELIVIKRLTTITWVFMVIKLTIIVPFYNVEPYIEECIRSLYNQDIPVEEYEVICVDDCSQDGSRAIVERLQVKYPMLKLICHTENKRQGGARNTGLREAKGKYIWFVDSDDSIMPNTLNRLLSEAEKNDVDVLQFDYNCELKEHNEQTIQDGEAYLFQDKSARWDNRVVGPWRQLIRRQMLEENKLEFIEGAQYEDTDYMLRVFQYAKRVKYVPLTCYYYRTNGESTTLGTISPEKIAWRINQLARCALMIDVFQTQNAKGCISTMVTNSFSALRIALKGMTKLEKNQYRMHLSPLVSKCKTYMNWRTWLSIRYTVTIFI